MTKKFQNKAGSILFWMMYGFMPIQAAIKGVEMAFRKKSTHNNDS